jgi:hypothetical protein
VLWYGDPAATSAQLTAERDGTILAGQTYVLNITCNDDGEISHPTLTITVPHDLDN